MGAQKRWAEGGRSGNLDFGRSGPALNSSMSVTVSFLAELQEVGKGWGLGTLRTVGLPGMYWLHSNQRHLDLQGGCGAGP